jgi:hypothetical protein
MYTNMHVIQILIAEMVFNTGLNIEGQLNSLLSGFCHFQQEKGHKRLEKGPLKSKFVSKTSPYTSLRIRKVNSYKKAMAFILFCEEGQ